MTFSYSDPSNSDMDAVRYKIGDTNEDSMQLSNEEINYELELAANNVILASAKCAFAISAKYTRLVSKTIGDKTINYSDLASQYKTLSDYLQSEYEKTFMTFGMPKITRTKDSKYYPAKFNHNGINSCREWDI